MMRNPRTPSAMRNLALLALLAPLVGVTFGCSSTSLTSSWKDPATGMLPSGGKVLAIAISTNPSIRRSAEDEMVKQIGAGRATASYTLLDESDLKNTDSARIKVSNAKFDYALALRPVSNEKELNWVPGTTPMYGGYGGGFWGYYGSGWGGMYDPGYMRTDTILQVETLLYSLSTDKVVWSGLMKTVNPTNAPALVREIAAAAVKDMKAKGLIAK